MLKPNLSTISITDLTGFSNCRRSWWLSEFYEPMKPALHYWVGTTVHAALEGYYKNGRNFEAGLQLMEMTAESSLEKLSRTFEFTWSDSLPEFEQALQLCRDVYQNYCIFDYSKPIEGEVLETEQYIKVPLPSYGGKVSITGRVDLIMTRKDQLWIIDHKTAKQRESSYAGLDVDEQLTGYAWLAWRKYGVVPTAVIYNIIIKDVPNPPRVLKDGSLSKDKSQSTVHSLYLEAIDKLGGDRTPYLDILQNLEVTGWSKFFSREGATRNLDELRNFGDTAERKAADILGILTDPAKNAYPTASTITCGWCPFLAVCKSMNEGGDFGEILKARFLERTFERNLVTP